MMLRIHKPNHKLLILGIASICGIGGLLGLQALTYTPELSHAETALYPKPETRTMADITYMQDITPEICQNTAQSSWLSPRQFTLTDIRDGSAYTVARIYNSVDSPLKDESNCWMTQNLRLVGEITLTPNDSDVKNDFVLPSPVNLDASKDVPLQFSKADQYQSKVFYNNNTTYGAYYNWYTATAGTGNELINADGANASSSICPKGWRLPTSGTDGEFYHLFRGKNNTNIQGVPYYFSLAGQVYNSIQNFTNSSGTYWSSTAESAIYSYAQFTHASMNPSSTYLAYRYYGQSIRCIAQKVNNNIQITVDNTISLEVDSEIEVEKSDNNPSATALPVSVASNQPYSVSISSTSPNLTSANGTTIPATSGLLNSPTNGWGIKKYSENTYTAITNNLQTFYTASGAEIKTIPLQIGISTSPDLPNGEYSTDITITATQN